MIKLISLTVLFFALFINISGCENNEKNYYDEPKPTLAGAEDYKKALEFLRKKNYTAAIPWLNLSANKKNPEAEYQLGLLYARGDGVEANYKEAHQWLLKSAFQGHPKAQYHLGHMYSQGDGVDKNLQESFVWFWIAASSGEKNSRSFMRILVNKLDGKQYKKAEERVNVLWEKIPHDIFIHKNEIISPDQP